MSDLETRAEAEMAEKKMSAATRLVEIALEKYRLGMSTEDEAFAIPRSGPKVVSLLRGSRTSLRNELAREYFRRTGKAAGQQALADALLVIEGMAQEVEQTRLYLRVAKHDGALWLDLGDQTGRAVCINAGGWHIAVPPVLFKRVKTLTDKLPEPQIGGSLDDLWRLLNVHEADRPLLVAWLVCALTPDIPHPILSLFGEQGTGKSMATRMLVTLLDPSRAPLRKPPRDPDQWVTAAAGSWAIGLDNLSHIPEWLSDAMCRAVSFEADVRRRLYTDGEHVVFAFRRCLIINGIDVGGLKGDLSQRLLPVTLSPITEDRRQTDEEMLDDWRKVQPAILGALLDIAASVAALPYVRLDCKPRMADFAQVLADVDRVLGTKGFAQYAEKQRALALDSLHSDPFMLAVLKLGHFQGTSAELLQRIPPPEGRQPKAWPETARIVTTRLRRHAPAMRESGWTVSDDGGANHSKALIWTLSHKEMVGNSDPRHPQDPQCAGVAGVAGVENRPSLHDMPPQDADKTSSESRQEIGKTRI